MHSLSGLNAPRPGAAPPSAVSPKLHSEPGQEEGTIPVLARWVGSWQISLRRRAMSAGELRGSYDRVAPGWSRTLDRLGVPGAYEALLHGVLGAEATADGGARRRVLDCGVGTGALSCALAGVSPAPFALDAIDIAPRMLERAGQRLRACGLAPALRQGDVRVLPYEDGVFDLVMSAHMLEHLADPGVALAEMVRVLKPGGLLVLCLTRHSPLGMLVQLKWRTHRVTPAQAEGWLRESGLTNARSLSLDGRAVARQLSVACAGRKPITKIQGGFTP